MGIIVFFYQDVDFVIRDIKNEGVRKPAILTFMIQPPDFQGFTVNDLIQGVVDKADIPNTLHHATVYLYWLHATTPSLGSCRTGT
jgi:hypothetical protein